MGMKGYYPYHTYMMANKHNTVLYTGITGIGLRRIKQHKNKEVEGFTKRYNVVKLVFWQGFDDINVAIAREKQIKRWSRKKKDHLINLHNPDWEDLYNVILKRYCRR
jgi:putative endonuclease